MRNRIMSFAVSVSASLALFLIMAGMSSAQTASPQAPPSSQTTTAPDQSNQTPAAAAPTQATPPAAQSQPSATQQGSTNSSGGQASTIDEELGLTPDQKQKIATVVDDENKQISAVRDDGSLSLEQKQQKVMQIRQTGTPKIKAILTPEQLQKLAAIQQRMHDQQQGSQQSSPQSQPQH